MSMNAEPQPAAPPAGNALAEAAQLRFLDPRRLRFFKAGAALRLTIEGERSLLRVSVLRAFPLTVPDRYYSVRDGDNQEAGLIADPAGLDPESRARVEADLARRYMISRVNRIRAVKERFGTVDWEVETPRGIARFTTRDLRDNVLRPAPGRILFTDADDNRYEIPDIGALDAQSRIWLLRHL